MVPTIQCFRNKFITANQTQFIPPYSVSDRDIELIMLQVGRSSFSTCTKYQIEKFVIDFQKHYKSCKNKQQRAKWFKDNFNKLLLKLISNIFKMSNLFPGASTTFWYNYVKYDLLIDNYTTTFLIFTNLKTICTKLRSIKSIKLNCKYLLNVGIKTSAQKINFIIKIFSNQYAESLVLCILEFIMDIFM